MRRTKIPNSKKRVIIICEGQEDQEYIKKIISLKVWKTDIYDFITENSKGAGNLVSKYESIVSNESNSSIVLIFCDTDKSPHEQYMSIKAKLRNIYGGDSAFNRIVIYANPCTMRIVLAHFSSNTKLKSQNKSENATLIEKLTNVKNYKAAKKQISTICSKINIDNYNLMKEVVKKDLNKNYAISGSTNIITFLERFESNDTSWINEINKALYY